MMYCFILGYYLLSKEPDFHGCYSNKKNSIFREVAFTDDKMTITLCLNYCRSIEGMINAGLGKGKQCFCGDGTISLRSQKKDSDCKVPCKGDSDEVCGDKSNVSVYDGKCPRQAPKHQKLKRGNGWAWATWAIDSYNISGCSLLSLFCINYYVLF